VPTGYTDAIKDGIDFRTFAMNCARAFGACVMLRDDGGGGDKIPESFQPSDYHVKALAKTRSDLAAVELLSAEDCALSAANAWQQQGAAREKRQRDREVLRLKYEAMLAQVDAWEAPTPDHGGLKNFMREQITQSIDFDCADSPYSEQEPKLSGAEWRAKEISRLCRAIEYHERENAKEVERTDERNRWIAALRKSLHA
jgi:hypothetical protein